MGSLHPRLCSWEWTGRARNYLTTHLNFYRIHLLFFTFAPLIVSGIFYASNEEFHISYIDALYNSVSALTVCGLTTVDLSALTPWQQVLLFILMCIGNPVIISWVVVYTRRVIFRKQFEEALRSEMQRRIAEKANRRVNVTVTPWWRRILSMVSGRGLSAIEEESESDTASAQERGRSFSTRLRPDMIRRVDDAPKLINPSGYISEGQKESDFYQSGVSMYDTRGTASQPASPAVESPSEEKMSGDASPESEVEIKAPSRRLSDPGTARQTRGEPSSVHRYETIGVPAGSGGRGTNFASLPLPDRTRTVEFTSASRRPRETSINRRPRRTSIPHTGATDEAGPGGRPFVGRSGIPVHPTLTSHTHHSTLPPMQRGFGGFPMPHEIISSLIRRFFPKFEHKVKRTLTIPHTQTIASQHAHHLPGVRKVPYITFEAVVGPNSEFLELDREQLEELGGVEYRALTALLWLVGGYHIVTQLVAFTVIAPYISIRRWQGDFTAPPLHRPVSSTWFSLFQVVSAYTNTGMSLVDTSMVPFQRAYPMILIMAFLILAGNTAFPVFLRLLIWTVAKLVPAQSRLYTTLHFLLDHPRRCFIYLFPSHQTWFLVTVLFALNLTDWFFFLVLDLGNPAITSIPAGVRVIIGLLQATAVRAAGFATVALSALAPAVKVLFLIMMYISVYPIAMSVRSTNVYEEQSLGVYEDKDALDEPVFEPNGSRVTVFSRYLAMHMRKQLSFDMWWLALALFLVCIIERDGLDNVANQGWFNIFTILFELVSAYGSVGLSLGLPYANYSFSGALRPLSKLIICAVMIRGRHRGLPVAIDRAVMLPPEFSASLQDTPQADSADTHGRQDSVASSRHDDETREKWLQDALNHQASWRSRSRESMVQRRSRTMAESPSKAPGDAVA